MVTTIKAYSENSVISLRVFNYLIRKGFISDPLSAEDLIRVSFLESIWCDRTIIKSQLSRMKKSERKRFINSCEYKTKWERYVFTRFSKHLIDFGAKSKLSVKTVIEEIEHFYKVKIGKKRYQRLLDIRKQVYNLRQYKHRHVDLKSREIERD